MVLQIQCRMYSRITSNCLLQFWIVGYSLFKSLRPIVPDRVGYYICKVRPIRSGIIYCMEGLWTSGPSSQITIGYPIIVTHKLQFILTIYAIIGGADVH